MAYGRILPPAVLEAPRLGCLNLHASLLPAYRGAAPIQWALIGGETQTGISLMQMDAGLDTGPVFCERALNILPDWDAGRLHDEIAALGNVVIREELPRALEGELTATPQDDSQASHARPLTAEDTHLDLSQPADRVLGWIRGLGPRPGAQVKLGGKRLKILAAKVLERESRGEVGRVVLADKGAVVVQTGEGTIGILRAQLEGRKALDAADLVNGRAIAQGQTLE
jgi:methionyl-tRNA formyltransferase